MVDSDGSDEDSDGSDEDSDGSDGGHLKPLNPFRSNFKCENEKKVIL